MQRKELESAAKLSGSYYTPDKIADFLSNWGLGLDKETIRILEPSCGDGAFIRSLHRVNEMKKHSNLTITGIEFNKIEANKAKNVATNIPLTIHGGDFFKYVQNNPLEFGHKYDLVLGNPPYIRYQNFEYGRDEAVELFNQMDIITTKHANAWLYFLGVSLSQMEAYSRIGMVIPAEILHIGYASGMRERLLKELDKVMIITFRELVFPNVQQEVVLLLGEKTSTNHEKSISFIHLDNLDDLNEEVWTQNKFEHAPALETGQKWNRYYLNIDDLRTYEMIMKSENIKIFDHIAEVGIGIVTGANAFFCIDEETKRELGIKVGNNKGVQLLRLLGKSAEVPGLQFTKRDFKTSVKKGKGAFLLYFDEDFKRGNLSEKLSNYLTNGEDKSIHTGYKCSIREPWYVVPYVFRREIGMFKRAGVYNKFIVNKIGAYSTDTIHRIALRESSKQTAEQFSFAALNSLTLLSMELLGRNYGGGVLEMVPGEIKNLPIPEYRCTLHEFEHIDKLLRGDVNIEFALDYVDERVLGSIPKRQRESLRASWKKLQERRVNRGKSK